jgi:hypothetical protein
VGKPTIDTQPVVIQFYRWDRENDLDPALESSGDPKKYHRYKHSYGNEIDRILDELAGPFDRTIEWPTGPVADTGVTVVLHEDGPTFQLVFEQLPQFISAATGLFSAWVAWRSTRRREPGGVEPRRTARIEIGEHTYVGPATDPEQLADVVRAIAAMEKERVD